MKRLLALFALMSLPLTLYAQTASSPVPAKGGTVTLSVAPTSGTGTVSAVVTWAAAAAPDGVGASSCTGSWASGALAASGSTSLSVTATTTYAVACTWNDTSVVLNWVAPTANTNGTALSSTQLPLTYNLLEGATGAETAYKQGLTGLTYTATGLAAGTNCFTLTAEDALANVSTPSTEVCKANGSVTANATATLTVTAAPAVPSAPTGVTIK